MNDDAFLAHRPLILRIAYDITGSWPDAEDIAQDVYLRWRDVEEVREPRAYLARAAANAAIDSVAASRYTGPLIPGPVFTGPGADAAIERAEEVELALARVLQRCSAPERAAFLLHDVFGFPHAEVAAMLDREPDAVRQLASRARRRLAEERPTARVDKDAVRELAERFSSAALGGNLDDLRSLLAEEALLVSDGGGRASTALRPVTGSERVARFLAGIGAGLAEGWTFEWRPFNGRPALLVADPSGRVDSVFWVEPDASGRRVARIDIVRDPRKLAHLEPAPGSPR